MDNVREEMLKGREPVCEQCIGEGFNEDQQEFLKEDRCDRIVVDEQDDNVLFCSAYIKPAAWWSHDKKRCPLATHYRPDLQVTKGRNRVGQQKQRKR